MSCLFHTCAKDEIRSTQKNAYNARISKHMRFVFLMRLLNTFDASTINPYVCVCVIRQCVQVEVVLLNLCPVTITRRTRTRYIAWMTVTDPIPCGCMKQSKATCWSEVQCVTRPKKTSKTRYFWQESDFDSFPNIPNLLGAKHLHESDDASGHISSIYKVASGCASGQASKSFLICLVLGCLWILTLCPMSSLLSYVFCGILHSAVPGTQEFQHPWRQSRKNNANRSFFPKTLDVHGFSPDRRATGTTQTTQTKNKHSGTPFACICG